MRKIYHLPTQISFPESLPAEVRLRLQTVIHASISRAIGQAAGGAEVVMAAGPGQSAREQSGASRSSDAGQADRGAAGYGTDGSPERPPA